MAMPTRGKLGLGVVGLVAGLPGGLYALILWEGSSARAAADAGSPGRPVAAAP